MLDNIDVAVLTKLNKLAELNGFKAYEFTATFQQAEGASQYQLVFEALDRKNPAKRPRFEAMLTTLGVDETGLLKGSVEMIVNALDRALDASRKQGPRLQGPPPAGLSRS